MSVKDQIQFRSPEAAASGAMQVISAIQQMRPADQVIGTATFLLLLCERLAIDPREMLSIVERMDNDCRWRNVHSLDAVRRYIDGELRGKL